MYLVSVCANTCLTQLGSIDCGRATELWWQGEPAKNTKPTYLTLKMRASRWLVPPFAFESIQQVLSTHLPLRELYFDTYPLPALQQKQQQSHTGIPHFVPPKKQPLLHSGLQPTLQAIYSLTGYFIYRRGSIPPTEPYPALGKELCRGEGRAPNKSPLLFKTDLLLLRLRFSILDPLFGKTSQKGARQSSP